MQIQNESGATNGRLDAWTDKVPASFAGGNNESLTADNFENTSTNQDSQHLEIKIGELEAALSDSELARSFLQKAVSDSVTSIR